MKSNSLRLAAAFMLAALTTLALAQGFTLKRAAKAGDTAKYRLKADIDVAGTSATFTAVLTEKILRVEDNGNYVVESNQTEGKVIFSGTEMPAPAQSPTVTIYRPTGEVAEIRGEVQD
ncbi:MAG TPA: hypothetical protein VM328_13450, partial [Fimbriimonadaceae bacterium]|nr:hypothetical protein [Fimbriimonadaceae bacterium]